MEDDSEESREVDAALLRQCTCGGVAGCEPCTMSCAIFGVAAVSDVLTGAASIRAEEDERCLQALNDAAKKEGRAAGKTQSFSSYPLADFKRYSQLDVLKILTNMGHDVTCGACMEVAFTGATLSEHTHSTK